MDHEQKFAMTGSSQQQAGSGCCADGEKCDELCIQVAAARECQAAEKACHGTEAEVPPGCGDGCCSDGKAPGPVAVEAGTCKDDCCDANEDSDEEDSCCGEAHSSPGADEKGDDCCEGTGNTSCSGGAMATSAYKSAEEVEASNSSCCTKVENASISHKGHADDDADGIPFVQACAEHLRQAFLKYEAYLEQGRCICRSVLGDLDACCNKEKRDSIKASGKPNHAHHRVKKHRSTSKVCKSKTGAFSSKKVATILSEDEIHSRCSQSEEDPRLSNGKTVQVTQIQSSDVEKTAARELVMLSVAGMTCTGCANKVTKTLNRIDGVGDIKVNFVASMGEFTVDQNRTTAASVLAQLERETGFNCSRIITDLQSIDLILSKTQAKKFGESLPPGVESLEKVGKAGNVFCAIFNPAIIGARDVLASSGSTQLGPPRNESSLSDGRKRLLNMAWSTAAAAVLTIPIVVLAWSDNPVSYSKRSIISLVFATIVQGIAVPEFYVGAVKSLVFSRVIEMDMLIVISVTAAYGYSVVAFALTHAGNTLEVGEFFETSSLLITLVLLGRLVSAYARLRAVTAVSLRSLQAESATLVKPSGETVELDARLLQFGDILLIPPHSRIVTDGEVIRGNGAVDESMLTGESIPTAKASGDAVIAGTINGPSPLTIRLQRLPGKNSISDIAGMVENALGAKPRVQDLADKVAGWFIPTVVLVSIVAFIAWLVVALKLQGKNAGGAVGVAITYGIAVLAVSCPCGLGLVVPMVLVIAGGVAARSGIIIKLADATERGFKVTDVVFDKTGTLTKGDLQLVQEKFITSSHEKEAILALTCALVKDNGHPVSEAVSSAIKNRIKVSEDVENIQSVPGAGIQADWKGHTVKAGNPYWLGIAEHPEILDLMDQGLTLLCITANSKLLAVYGLKSTLRDEATTVVRDLRRRGIRCHVVSGDGPSVVKDIAHSVGIDPGNVAARHSPAEKQKYVQDLMSGGKYVLFCGDGTNDAVAIAQAHVGVQIGSASDVTRATADVVLLGGLEGIPRLLDLSKRAFRRIVFNFAWSAVYNVFAILLAGGAFVKVRIPPAYAGLGEIVSVLPVIFVALTLLRHRP